MGSFVTNGRTATSRNDKCFGASEKAYEIPSLMILKISHLCLFRAAPPNVAESREDRSLQSEHVLLANDSLTDACL